MKPSIPFQPRSIEEHRGRVKRALNDLFTDSRDVRQISPEHIFDFFGGFRIVMALHVVPFIGVAVLIVAGCEGPIVNLIEYSPDYLESCAAGLANSLDSGLESYRTRKSDRTILLIYPVSDNPRIEAFKPAELEGGL